MRDLVEAKQRSPQVVELIEKPEKFVKELGKARSENEKCIKMSVFSDYHNKVVTMLKDLFEEVKDYIPTEAHDLLSRFE